MDGRKDGRGRRTKGRKGSHTADDGSERKSEGAVKH